MFLIIFFVRDAGETKETNLTEALKGSPGMAVGGLFLLTVATGRLKRTTDLQMHPINKGLAGKGQRIADLATMSITGHTTEIPCGAGMRAHTG